MTVLYQCMTFWYKAYVVLGMSLTTIQVLDRNEDLNKMSQSIDIVNGQWLFGEMPLLRRFMRSKVLIWCFQCI